jgi:hypothetical protein
MLDVKEVDLKELESKQDNKEQVMEVEEEGGKEDVPENQEDNKAVLQKNGQNFRYFSDLCPTNLSDSGRFFSRPKRKSFFFVTSIFICNF